MFSAREKSPLPIPGLTPSLISEYAPGRGDIEHWTPPPHLLPMLTINRMLSELLQVPLPLPTNQPGLMEQTRFDIIPTIPLNFCLKQTHTQIYFIHSGEFLKRVREMSSQLFVTLYILSIYPSAHKQLIRQTTPESFSRIALYII